METRQRGFELRLSARDSPPATVRPVNQSGFGLEASAPGSAPTLAPPSPLPLEQQ